MLKIVVIKQVLYLNLKKESFPKHYYLFENPNQFERMKNAIQFFENNFDQKFYNRLQRKEPKEFTFWHNDHGTF